MESIDQILKQIKKKLKQKFEIAKEWLHDKMHEPILESRNKYKKENNRTLCLLWNKR